MATTSTPHKWKYDVFVSFRGEDIRKSFMDHLFKDFRDKGIHAFRDDNELPRGEEISPQLYKAIQESRFLMVIFSKNYASSSWCLRELVKILECKQMGNPKHEVRIIFYDVKPDVVRKQKRSYAEAFAKHEVSNAPEVAKWKEALSMAANLSGWDLHEVTNGYESKFIDNISEDILNKLCYQPLHVGENLVGIDTNAFKLNILRYVGSNKVNMIGICGISGIGKTTFAKAIYNSMYTHFEGSFFYDDVQGVTKRQGLMEVQRQFIYKILKTKHVKISNISEGIMVIKQRVASKSILLVLDDVDNVEQLEATAGSPDWFFPGSLIIITARDKQLLRSHRVDEIYEMEFLDDYESLKLFCLHAFGQTHPAEDFKELSRQVVDHLQGHPLALKVYGRFLYEKSVRVWKSALGRLQTYHNSEILQKLRPSFDGLAFDQKRIFLDIACSFMGENKDFVASVLESSTCFADANIEVLVDKSLITILPDDMSLQMHDLIQTMALEIVREESNIPGNQIRLLVPEEAYDVLRENKATEVVEILDLFRKKSSREFEIDGKAFAHMKNLRILKLPGDSKVNFSGRLEYLSNKLRLLYWHGCPFKYFPSDFNPENIVAIDLSYSHIQYLWTKPKCLRRLKVMKLSHCRNLISTPDFKEIINLEELYLDGCVKLTKVCPSIGMLKRLVVLYMKDCTSLRGFPCKVEMDALQVLNLSRCLNLDRLPDVLGTLKALVELHIDGIAITEFPSFIFSLTNLQVLSIGRYRQAGSRWWTSILQKQPRSLALPSLASLHFLRELTLSYCNILEVPDSIGGLSCLLSLDLDGNNFTSLPGSLSQLSDLRVLRLDGCKNLEVLPELPPSIFTLIASDCTSLRELPGHINFNHAIFTCAFNCCPKLFRDHDSESQVSMYQPHFHGSSNQLFSLLQYMCIPRIGQFFRGFPYLVTGLDIMFHSNTIPHWFTNQSMGSQVNVELPLDWCHNTLRGYGTCVIFKPKRSYSNTLWYDKPQYFVNNFDGAPLDGFYPLNFYQYVKKDSIRIHRLDMIWLHYTRKRETREWKEAKNFVSFSFEDNEDVEVKQCGVRIVYDEDIDKNTDLSMFQDLPTPVQDGGSFQISGYEYINLSW